MVSVKTHVKASRPSPSQLLNSPESQVRRHSGHSTDESIGRPLGNLRRSFQCRTHRVLVGIVPSVRIGDEDSAQFGLFGVLGQVDPQLKLIKVV